MHVQTFHCLADVKRKALQPFTLSRSNVSEECACCVLRYDAAHSSRSYLTLPRNITPESLAQNFASTLKMKAVDLLQTSPDNTASYTGIQHSLWSPWECSNSHSHILLVLNFVALLYGQIHAFRPSQFTQRLLCNRQCRSVDGDILSVLQNRTFGRCISQLILSQILVMIQGNYSAFFLPVSYITFNITLTSKPGSSKFIPLMFPWSNCLCTLCLLKFKFQATCHTVVLSGPIKSPM